MAIETQDALEATTKPPAKPHGWLREQQKALREKYGDVPYEFTPIHIDGESLSMTIIRERRGDFDD